MKIVQEIELLKNYPGELTLRIFAFSDDPAEWVITDSLIDCLKLKEIK